MADKIDLGKIGYDVYVNDKRFGNNLRKMERDAERSADNIGETFTRLGKIIAAGMMFRRGWIEAKSFSKELANVKSIADDLSKGKLRKEILNLNPVLGTAAELTNALFFAYSSGVQGSEREMAQFTGKVAELAKTINAGITPTMDAFTTIMNAYGLGVKDAGDISDWFFQIIRYGKAEGAELATYIGQIISTAAMAKIPLDELGAAIATLSNIMPASQAITALNQVILGFIQPTSEARRVAAELDIELSAAALQSKGLAGALADVNAKAGDNVDALTAMFTSVRAFKAAASLAGTQAKDFQKIATEFGNKGGAAAKGFAESIDNLEDQAAILGNTGKRLLEMIVGISIRVLTLNGALFDTFRKIGEINASTLETIARMIALVAGLVAVRKAIGGLSALKTGFVGLAIKGGYQTQAMKEAKLAELSAQAVKSSELQKELAIKKTNTIRQVYLKKHELDLAKEAELEAVAAAESARAQLARIQLARTEAEAAAIVAVESAKTKLEKAEAEAAILASSQRNAALHEALSAKKIMLDKQEIASAMAKALAIEKANLRILQTQNESARYQYALKNGSSKGFKPDPALAQSQSQVNALTKEYTNAQKAAAVASVAATNARNAAIAAAKTDSVATKELAVAKTAVAAAERNLQIATANAQKARAAAIVAGKADSASTKELTRAKSALTRAEKNLAAAKNQTVKASAAFTVSSRAARQAAMEEKNQLIAATAAQHAHSAAMNGTTKSAGILRGTLISLKAAFLANPITTALMVIGAVASGLMLLADKAQRKAEELVETAKKNSAAAEKVRDDGKKLRHEDGLRVERLKQLAEKAELNNGEMAEAEKLMSDLKKTHTDLGVELDKTTGKLNVQAGAWDKVRAKMLEVAKTESLNVMKSRAREIDVIDAKYKQSGRTREYSLWGLLYKEEQSNTSLRDLNPNELQGMMQSGHISAQQKELIKQYLDARDAWRTERQRYQALQSGDLTGGDSEIPELEKRINADQFQDFGTERKRINLQREINLMALQNQRLMDGILSKHDELALLKEKIRQKDREIEEEQKRINSAKTKELELEARKLQETALSEKYQLEREKREKEREIREEKYTDQMRKATVQAWSDGRLTTGEQIGLAKLNRDQAQGRVDDARKDVAGAPTEALRLEAQKILEEQMIELGKATAAVREALQSGGNKYSVQAAVKGSLEDYQLRMNTRNNINQQLLTEMKNQTKTQNGIREELKNNKTPVTLFGKVS